MQFHISSHILFLFFLFFYFFSTFSKWLLHQPLILTENIPFENVKDYLLKKLILKRLRIVLEPQIWQHFKFIIPFWLKAESTKSNQTGLPSSLNQVDKVILAYRMTSGLVSGNWLLLSSGLDKMKWEMLLDIYTDIQSLSLAAQGVPYSPFAPRLNARQTCSCLTVLHLCGHQ